MKKKRRRRKTKEKEEKKNKAKKEKKYLLWAGERGVFDLSLKLVLKSPGQRCPCKSE